MAHAMAAPPLIYHAAGINATTTIPAFYHAGAIYYGNGNTYF